MLVQNPNLYHVFDKRNIANLTMHDVDVSRCISLDDKTIGKAKVFSQN